MRKKRKYAWFVTTVLFRLLARFEYEVLRLSQTEDIEALHQARVYIRKLRVAFSLFAERLSATDCHSWQKAIISLGKSLRDARDIDVQIEKLQLFLEQAQTLSDRAVISALIDHLRQQRNDQQTVIQKAQFRFFKKKPFVKARYCLQKLLSQQEESGSLQQAVDKILDRFSRLIKDQAVIPSMSEEALHDFRKEIRYFRYELEILEIYCSEKVFSRAIKEIKVLQEILGNIHDCDVWRSDLSDYLQEEICQSDLSSETRQAVISGLIEQQQAVRAQAFSSLIEQIENMYQSGFWEQLAKTLLACP